MGERMRDLVTLFLVHQRPRVRHRRSEELVLRRAAADAGDLHAHTGVDQRASQVDEGHIVGGGRVPKRQLQLKDRQARELGAEDVGHGLRGEGPVPFGAQGRPHDGHVPRKPREQPHEVAEVHAATRTEAFHILLQDDGSKGNARRRQVRGREVVECACQILKVQSSHLGRHGVQQLPEVCRVVHIPVGPGMHQHPRGVQLLHTGGPSRQVADRQALDAHYLRLRCAKGIQHKLAGAADVPHSFHLHI
mmetsp:Transcript_31934/g.76068  ORF Transcript_31934/g.76068 Transcript_31934/m.76068 type:complete len:248 (-) Transcript_31934:1343-2086(-)